MKFGWTGIDEKYRYFAIDYNGAGYAYISKPSRPFNSGLWAADKKDKRDYKYIGSYDRCDTYTLLYRDEKKPSKYPVFQRITIDDKEYNLVPV